MPAETAGDRGSDPLAGACVSDTPFADCYSSHAPFAKARLRRSPLLRSSFLLIERRSLRTFSQADFCASTKAAHEKYEGTVIKKIKKFARRALTNDVRRANLY